MLSVLKTNFPEMKTAYILDCITDQGEDIIVFLINNNTIADIEMGRYDLNVGPNIESKPLDDNFIKGLRKIPQIN